LAHRGVVAACVAAVTIVVSGCGRDAHTTWPLPNGDLAGTRAVHDTRITRSSVGRLRVAWRFRFDAQPSFSGIFASTPVADADTVYVQDLRSNVFALVRDTGALRWRRRFGAGNDGPNGLAVDHGHVYGATDTEAFAVDASDGSVEWRRHLTNESEQFVDVAPIAWHDLVFVGTIGYAPFGRGKIYALDAKSGRIRWRFDTIARPWRHPTEAGGGGIWYPVSIDGDGRLYAGTANPTPWGGTPQLPNGAAFPGPALYTDSLVVLDARTGRLLWHDQVTAHDVRDYDFEATPILAGDSVFGAGKAGQVIAWSRSTQRRLWQVPVGFHLNDIGPLPHRRVTVCPGLLGGVETPMAYAAGRLFVPVVNLCGPGSAVTRQDVTSLDPAKGTGEIVALDARTGRTRWLRRLPSPNFGCATVASNVVFTSTYDGTVYGLARRDGAVLWRFRMRAGINACPAVVGDLLLVGAGVPNRPGAVPELVAFSAGGA
jgi:alcohol dehydrogenase (cytochrome c)